MNRTGTGKIFDIKRYAIHDGPGIRTTVFFKGCPLACLWCHNPEGLGHAPKILWEKDLCIGCRDCVAACDHNAVSATAAGMMTDPERCVGCGRCAAACPAEARKPTERTVTPAALLEEILRDELFHDESGGGVTFSGGEPLFQPEFLLEILKLCGRQGIHRAVDTAGFAPASVMERIAPETDLFLYDLKHTVPERHRQITGVSNRRILENLEWLHRAGASIILRIPLIPGMNDDDTTLNRFLELLKRLPNIREVHVLPYHAFQKSKYKKLGMPYPVEAIPKSGANRVGIWLDRLIDSGIAANPGG